MVQLHDLSLKWLTSFRETARSGSVREAALRLGLVSSTVSYHIRCLEEAVGARLLIHNQRPIKPTFEGEALVAAIDTAFVALEQGLFRLSLPDLSTLSQTIRVATIEDLDADIIPGLTHALRQRLPNCTFAFFTRPSHEVRRIVERDEAHIGIAARPDHPDGRLLETPLLTDPFLLVVPAAARFTAEQYLSDRTGLAFLNYGAGQFMRSRIDAELSRRKLMLKNGGEFDSTAAILGTVATGGAWTITTALNYARLSRLHDQIRPLAIPRGSFSRYISSFHPESFPGDLAALLRAEIVPLLRTRMISPTIEAAPWLRDQFQTLKEDGKG
ncbi:LysR family transcriptional regulator [Aestuariivita sp.]|jgi:DNA-binding transcriptional LysR family regulator|uniref:LysR substrate-binding domain-containing protein n=1 Tax=Aestuariivita sp. TaxID=1872407 RepID=UPI00216E9F6A|nr:LysR family transcriptional regulator [Aestuariivita sp.]MCE8007722.1 LysR family transcriptional regulator [Aestuariivita sp.]